MPSNSASTSRLRVALRWFATSFVVVAATWLSVVFWWRATQRAVSATDALLYMVALPVGLLMGVVLIHRVFQAKKSGPQDRLTQSNETTNSVDHPGNDDTKAHGAPLAIVGAWASTSLAPFGEELLEQLEERRTRPTPDELLTDEHGFPLLSGRMQGLDTSGVEADLTTALVGVPDADTELLDEARDALLRALAILDSLLAQIAEDWHRDLADMDVPPDQYAPAMTLRGLPEDTTAPEGVALEVKLLLSSELEAEEVRIAQAYITYRLSAYGISASKISISVTVSDDAPTAMNLAEEFRMNANTAPGNRSPQAFLLLSGVSNLCPTIVEEWESKGLTFSSQRPNGRMLGEAAFGLLCLNEKALEFTSTTPMCHLTPVISAHRSHAGKGKASEDVLAGAICKALDAAKLAGGAIGTVVCDADHRSDRTLESIGAMISQAPKLDAIHDRISIDEACGHLGGASTLGILAVGAMQAAHATHPILLFNVGHHNERAVALLRPVGIAADDATSQHLQAA